LADRDDESTPASSKVQLRDLSHREGSAAAELTRIRTSPSFRLGVLFIRAIENPLRFFRLPWDLVALAWEILRESRRKTEEEITGPLNRSIFLISGESTDDRRQERVIGMATEIGEVDSTVDTIHLSLSSPMLVKRPESMLEYSLPSSRMSSDIWGGLLSEQISLLLTAHRPAIIIYDGEYPHRGIIRALSDRPGHMSIWIEPIVENVSTHLRNSGGSFDYLIWPSDPLLEDNAESKLMAKYPPLFRVDQPQRTKMEVKKELDIPSDSLVAFFHPPGSPTKRQMKVFMSLLNRLRKERVILCMNPTEASDKWVGNYPRTLVRSLPTMFGGHWSAAFDMAIIDGSQTKMLKMIDSETPFITVPRLGVRDESDYLRAIAADAAGCSLMVADNEENSPEWALRKILNPIKRRRMRDACRTITLGNGLEQFTEWIFNQLD